MPARLSSLRSRRHLVVPAAIGLGLFLGVTTTGVAASAAVDSPASHPEPAALTTIVSDARATLVDARSALIDANATTAEVSASGFDIDSAVDTDDLIDAITDLSTLDILPTLVLPEMADAAHDAARDVRADTADLRQQLNDAEAQRAAEEAAAAAAAAQKAAEEAAAALAAANTVDGAKATAQAMAAERYGWGADQFSCLVSLWNKESSWNYQAYNASSGATGIPQALPGSKMASAGADWQSSAATQISWGLGYIASAYGTPCRAWGHSQATNWY